MMRDEMAMGIEGMRQLEVKLNRMAKAYQMHNTNIRVINETAAKMFERAMKRNITSYHSDIYVSRGDGKKSLKIKKGTYKRSIGSWLISEQGNAYWAGPRTGRKVGKTKDAWFAYIVESDQQYIEGKNDNIGVIEKVIKSRSRNINAWRTRQFKAYQKKVEQQMRRAQ